MKKSSKRGRKPEVVVSDPLTQYDRTVVGAAIELAFARRKVAEASRYAADRRDLLLCLLGEETGYSREGIDIRLETSLRNAIVDLDRMKADHPDLDIERYVLSPPREVTRLLATVSPDLVREFSSVSSGYL